MTSGCPFCSLDAEKIVIRNDHALACRDGFPVSPGHTLVLPHRHVASFFDLTDEERAALFDLLASARRALVEELGPHGFNIGINDGEAAGQTVGHLHVHLIPRFEGDAPDPRGGVRWIFPDKAAYWEDDAPGSS